MFILNISRVIGQSWQSLRARSIGHHGLRPTPVLLLLLLHHNMGKEAGSTKSNLSRRKRHCSSDADDVAAPTSLLQRIIRAAGELTKLRKPPHVYCMTDPADRRELIRVLWTGKYHAAIGSCSRENSHLIQLFGEQSLNNSADDGEAPAEARLHSLQSSWPRFEGLMALLFRARSKDLVPLWVAAFSVRALHYKMPRHLWDSLVSFCRVLMSRSWTEDLCEEALQHDPGAPYTTASGVSAAVFDNFTMKVGYGSYATVDSSGQRLDMTNWASVLLPAAAIPPGFSIDNALGAGGIFRTDRRLADFIGLFSMQSADIVVNQQDRWREFLAAAEAGKLLEKPAFNSPYPPTHYHYHPPIWDHLQASYADVNFEVDCMRASPYHRYSDAIFLGGDGLSYMRLIHRLAQDARRYVETKPILIPQLGEHPHGTYHVLHGDWRMWWPLLEKFAQIVNNCQVASDPDISHFNEHEHFLRICARACAEYVVEISATGSDYRAVPHFLQAAERNLSFAYVCRFLYHSAFKYLQMRNAVRTNSSATLDLVWRENLATARTSLANKTNYAPMSIVRVYWGWALVEPLQTVYHNLRTLRQVFTHVGWDWPIENLNLMIRLGVTSNITRALVEKFIRRLNFTSVVNRGLDATFRANRTEDHATAKNIDTDVARIKDYLRAHIGSTFAEATAPSDRNDLELDLSSWGGARRARQQTPWTQMAAAMADLDEYVRQTITRMCPWHTWQP